MTTPTPPTTATPDTPPLAPVSTVRRYGPLVAIATVLVVMGVTVAVGNGEPGAESASVDDRGGEGAGVVDPLAPFAPRGVTTWGQAEAAGTTGDIEWGERCDTARGTLAYPAIDPPPCFAPFDGDNGGATSQGVTEDEITVVLYQAQEHDPILDYITGAIGADDSNADVARTLRQWLPILVGAGYTDSTIFARTYDQRQWAHAFGVTFLPARVDPDGATSTDLYRWFYGHAPPAESAGLTLLDLNLLYGGLQGVGPDLTPANFRRALFAAPPTPSGKVTFPVLSWGDHGFWPSTDYGGIDDATVVWWNPEARGPDEGGNQGTGMYEYVDGGRRFLPCEWPTTPLPLFDPDEAVDLYDRPPGAADLPRYEPPALRRRNDD